MNGLTGPTVLLLLTTLCLSFAQEKVTVEAVQVFYARQPTIAAPRGSSVKLSCEARYDLLLCDHVHAVWIHGDDQQQPCTSPRKYFTTVNETLSEDGSMRRRQVLTEIMDLTPEDDGGYQCKAVCENGETAMGHIININVQG